MIQMKPKKTSMSGFTLIEMIVVIIIIAVLAAIGIPQYLKAVEKARGAEGVRIVGAIRQAEERYLARFGSYVEVTPGDLANSGLDVETQNLKYFVTGSLEVSDDDAQGTGTTGTVIDPAAANVYTIRLSRNAIQFSTLSGFTANYEVLMDNKGDVLAPTSLK